MPITCTAAAKLWNWQVLLYYEKKKCKNVSESASFSSWHRDKKWKERKYFHIYILFKIQQYLLIFRTGWSVYFNVSTFISPTWNPEKRKHKSFLNKCLETHLLPHKNFLMQMPKKVEHKIKYSHVYERLQPNLCSIYSSNDVQMPKKYKLFSYTLKGFIPCIFLKAFICKTKQMHIWSTQQYVPTCRSSNRLYCCVYHVCIC